MSDFVDYQEKAEGFAVGQLVSFFGQSRDTAGVVVEVHPGIGMVDVDFPNGQRRIPVEDLQRFGKDGLLVTSSQRPSASRVALYWAAKNRQYKATEGEIASGAYLCPKCKEGVLQKTCYKREEGRQVKLLGCPECLFLVKPDDVIGNPAYKDPAESKKPFARSRIRAAWEV